jgi:hypothetical protein
LAALPRNRSGWGVLKPNGALIELLVAEQEEVKFV